MCAFKVGALRLFCQCINCDNTGAFYKNTKKDITKMADEEESNVNPHRPNVNGLSPKEGTPGTQVIIRGENLGASQSDIISESVVLCSTHTNAKCRRVDMRRRVHWLVQMGGAKQDYGACWSSERRSRRGHCHNEVRWPRCLLGCISGAPVSFHSHHHNCRHRSITFKSVRSSNRLYGSMRR